MSTERRSPDQSISTVNVIDEDGVPPLAVPTSVAVVLLGESPLPPPHAARPLNNAKARVTNPAARRRFAPRALSISVPAKNVPIRPSARGIVRRCICEYGSYGLFRLLDVVFTVTVNGTLVVLDVNVSELGLKLHVAPVGRLEHAKLTVPV